MQKPDLNQMWETFIKIPDLTQMLKAFQKNPTRDNMVRINNCMFNTIRVKIYPMISQLKSNGIIDWYHFLIHKSRRKDDPNLYFHIRFEPKKDIKDKEHVNDFLPEYCERDKTRQCKGVESIAGIDKSLLKNEEIEEAWRIIGEQSEWLLNMLSIYKEDVEMPALKEQIKQFFHYYFNMTNLQTECPYCRYVFRPDFSFML